MKIYTMYPGVQNFRDEDQTNYEISEIKKREQERVLQF